MRVSLIHQDRVITLRKACLIQIVYLKIKIEGQFLDTLGNLIQTEYMEGNIMIKQVNVNNFADVRKIVETAQQMPCDVGVHDFNNQIADAKSLLGMMSLSYTHPVKIVSEDEYAVNKIASVVSER